VNTSRSLNTIIFINEHQRA